MRTRTADEWAERGFADMPRGFTANDWAQPSREPAFLDATESLISVVVVRPRKRHMGFYALCQTCGREPATLTAVEARPLWASCSS